MVHLTPIQSRLLSLLLILIGTCVMGFVLFQPSTSKIAIVESTLGIAGFLMGVGWLGQNTTEFSMRSLPLFRFIPLILLVLTDMLGWAFPPIMSAMALAAAFALLFPLVKMPTVPRRYVIFLTILLAASISYNILYYYPLDNGVDSWAYSAVSVGIAQSGHYTNLEQPSLISQYYSSFPILSLGAAVLADVTGLPVPESLHIFPGILILLQPLLVFLLSRQIFDSDEAAIFSSILVVTASAVTQYINWPMAESIGISLLLLLLLLLNKPRRA